MTRLRKFFRVEKMEHNNLDRIMDLQVKSSFADFLLCVGHFLVD